MGRGMLVLGVLTLFLFGCASKNGDLQKFPGSDTNFALPKSGLSYTAHYTIDESGQQSTKTVWRSKDKLKIRYGLGTGTLELYFVENKAYSCFSSEKTECFDITSIAEETMGKALIATPDLSEATPVEDVNIGSTKGKCYTAPFPPASVRKFCLATGGVLAYDEYPIGNERHIEYATIISYSVDESVFALPATPKGMPSAG